MRGVMSAPPRVKYRGKEWYLDQRLKKMRNVNNPHEVVAIPIRFRDLGTVEPVSDEHYGELPPKKLRRLKALVDKGLTNHKLSTKETMELYRLYRDAGGRDLEMPKQVKPALRGA